MSIEQVGRGPSVEVRIQDRKARVRHEVIEKIEHKTPEVVEFQDLEVIVKDAPIKKLQAKVLLNDGGLWFDGKVIFYLNWRQSRYRDFSVNEAERIDFWLAYKIGDVEKLFLNLWGGTPVVLSLEEIYPRKNPYINVSLHFTGESLKDEKSCNYRLNAQSWNTLSLTDRC